MNNQRERRFSFQVFLDRNLNNQDAQAMLAKLNEASKNQVPDGSNKLVVPGVSVAENPFPVWLQGALEKSGLILDRMNWCYHRDCPTEQAAEAMRTWFETVLRPWLHQQVPQEQELISRLHSRSMDIPDGFDLEGF